MIPKVTHQIWFQGWKNLPEKYSADTEKLSSLNPNWEHMKWDEDSLRTECAKFSPEALAKFEEFPHMIQKIDFGRCVVLHNYGGVSVDCDAECLRPFEKTPGLDRYDLILSKNPLNRLENKVASFGFSKDMVMVNNATICCTKEHALMKQFIEFLIENESWNEDVVIDTQLKTGPLITSIFFNRYLDEPEMSILDHEIFEPWGSVTKRTVLDHKCDQSWTGFVALPVVFYKMVRNNLIWFLLLCIAIVKFVFIRKIVEKSLT